MSLQNGISKFLFFSLIICIVAILFISFEDDVLASSNSRAMSQKDLSGIVYLPIINNKSNISGSSNWYMAGANQQRTSWINEQVDGNMSVAWYRPIEAFLDFRSQIIAVDGILYISSARGLFALDAVNGDIIWRYDTSLPLGPSPTYSNGVIYIGGYDKRIHALDAKTGVIIWMSEEAGAGFEANPLVVNGKVLAGNRDGYFYALDVQQGNVVWRYPDYGQDPLDGSITQSAAYDSESNTVFFAGNDMFAYALDADYGNLNWKSNSKLNGQDFRNYWPVVYNDYLIFTTNSPYRDWISPGAQSSEYTSVHYPHVVPNLLVPECIEDGSGNGELYIGPRFIAGSNEDNAGIDWMWPDGTEVIDASSIVELLQEYPHLQYQIYLNKYTGEPYDTPVPIVFTGYNGNGAGYPPIVMPDGVIYQSSLTMCEPLKLTPIVGWHFGSQYLSITNQWSVIDEPQELSGGGNRIYRRRYFASGSSQLIDLSDSKLSYYWHASRTLDDQAPDHDVMYHKVGCEVFVGTCLWYGGKIQSVNGIYGNGIASPLIPHRGMLFLAKDNAILAFSSVGGGRQLPLLEINSPEKSTGVPNQNLLLEKLDNEILKILEVYNPQDPNRFLMPGYYNDGIRSQNLHDDYFRNPGETLYTLSMAYPHVSSEVRQQLYDYLVDYYQTFFGSTLYSDTGWAIGSTRNHMNFPPEVILDLANHPQTVFPGYGWTWNYPQINIYALWKYAQINPNIVQDAYSKAKSVIEFHDLAEVIRVEDGNVITLEDHFLEYPFELQSYVAGYIGYLGLYNMVGEPVDDIEIKTQAEQARDTYLDFRYQTFSKDTYWYDNGFHYRRVFNIARNFMWLVPEVADYLKQNIHQIVEDTVTEYDYVAPFWFITGFQASYMESAAQPLFDSPAIFQAKAWILQEPQSELNSYLDVPVFLRGDLFYIQNLIATIEAPEDIVQNSCRSLRDAQ